MSRFTNHALGYRTMLQVLRYGTILVLTFFFASSLQTSPRGASDNKQSAGDEQVVENQSRHWSRNWRQYIDLRLSALAAGIRFIPDPGERSYLNDPLSNELLFPEQNESGDQTTRHPADATVSGASTEPPAKQQDRLQSFGILLRAGEKTVDPQSAGFFYRVDLGFFFQEGGGGFQREGRDTATDESGPSAGTGAGMSAGTGADAKKTEPQPLAFYPGNDLFVGFRTGEGLDIALGRKSLPAYQDNLSGGHGPLTGLHLGLENQYATLRLTPYHRHSLAGNYLPDGGDPAQLHRMGLRQNEDLRTITRGSESYGQSVALIGRLGILRLGLNYAANRQEETARLADSSRTIDRIEYAGGGIGLGNSHATPAEQTRAYEKSWEVYLHLERSIGFTRALQRDLNGNQTIKIDGRALRAGGQYRGEAFHFALRLFLPEPASLASTGNKGRSGYIGYGDSAPTTPLLAGALDTRPAPVLCRDRARCEGLEINSDQPGFANHANVAEVALGWRGQRILLGLDAAWLQPVAPHKSSAFDAARAADLANGTGAIFPDTAPDENTSAYGEIAIMAGWRFPAGRLRFQYARLIQQRQRTGASRLAGEALYLTMEYDL